MGCGGVGRVLCVYVSTVGKESGCLLADKGTLARLGLFDLFSGGTFFL